MANMIVLGTIIEDYNHFFQQCQTLKLVDVCDFKHIIDGTALAKAMQVKVGPWIKGAKDVVMEWQLRNPEVHDSSAVIADVQAWLDNQAASEQAGGGGSHSSNTNSSTDMPPKKKRRQKQGELTSALTTHIVKLTLRPIFSQSRQPTLTSTGRRNPNVPLDSRLPVPSFTDPNSQKWKTDPYALDLLSWVCNSLDASAIEREWGQLIPPILTILDDIEVAYKIRGCQLLHNLLLNTPPPLLQRTGLTPVFEQSLFTCTSYLPSLTPEAESIPILHAAYPVLLTLADIAHPPSSDLSSHEPQRTKFLINIMRSGILAGYNHAGDNPVIAVALLTHMPPLLKRLGVDTVVLLKELMPLLANVLADPFVLAVPELARTALTALKSLLANAWPRVWRWRVEVLRGICWLWIRMREEAEEEVDGKGERVREVDDESTEEATSGGDVWAWEKNECRTIMGMLDSVVAVADEVEAEVWRGEKARLVEADEWLCGLVYWEDGDKK